MPLLLEKGSMQVNSSWCRLGAVGAPVPGWLRVTLVDLWAWSVQSAGIKGLQLDLQAVQLGVSACPQL